MDAPTNQTSKRSDILYLWSMLHASPRDEVTKYQDNHSVDRRLASGAGVTAQDQSDDLPRKYDFKLAMKLATLPRRERQVISSQMSAHGICPWIAPPLEI